MKSEVLEMVKLLPPDKQQEVEEFVEYLLSKYKPAIFNAQLITEKRRSNAGRLRGQIWMADDFNETPEDFKEYL
jgi:hypothetical protein